ncbi:MAG: nuclear transport factor 2 family protein [Saccharofermentanales bacterium]|jgi:hypothetical protein
MKVEQPLENMLKKLWIIQECRNQMGRYEFYHSQKRHEDCYKLFALKHNDCWLENNDLGFFRGPESIRRFMVDFHLAIDGEDTRGSFCQHDLTTEVIVVADDLKTAKAVWMSPGVETRRDPVNGKLTSYWCWVKYAVDFIEEDGEWKFWHFTIFSDVFCDYHTAWVDTPITTAALPEMLSPDELITNSLVYSRNKLPPLLPNPPATYATYSGNTMTDREV